MCPLPKCSPPKVVEADLRPIALTLQLAKIREGFTYSSSLSQVQDQLDDKQFAVARKSTTQALVYFMHVILESFDREGMYARILFTDFSKGFTLVDRRALLHELEVLGVHEAIVRWVGAFLVDRQQRVRINGQLSLPISPRGRIPQGTRLAPLLLAGLVNRLASEWRTLLKYVDDLTILELIPRNSNSYLPIIASNVNKYSPKRNMKLNPKKCKEMVVDFLQYKSTCSSPLIIGGALDERVSLYKLLGVIVSDDLSWNAHCEYIYDKATKRLYGLRILKKSDLSPSDLVSVYCSTIRSVLEYASPVWAALSAYLNDLLEQVQRKALYIVFPDRCYSDALHLADLELLSDRR